MKIQDWGADFLQEVLVQAGAREDGEFQETVFTEEAVGYLVQSGECIDPEPAFQRGRGTKLNAWDLHEETDSVDLFVSLFDGTEPCRKVPRSEASDMMARGRRFLQRSLEGLWKELEESSEAFVVAQTLSAMSGRLKRARVYLLTNGLVDPEPFPDVRVGGVEVSHYVCDLGKLFQASGAGAIREPIEIGPEGLGGGLPCVRLPGDNGVYDSYVGVIPGAVLAGIYQRWGQRILERNVRSYLQARGAVNKRILETVQREPGMFLAYNNGISTVAEAAEVESKGDGVVIRRLRNFQIVNGAQTTASLHDAGKHRGVDLSQVYVQLKLTVIRNPARVDELVPFISRYANTQTKVNLSDFSANDPFHIQLERLSRATWVPSGRGKSTTKWYYERARGGYINDMNAEGTDARKRAFKATYPKSQMLNKTTVAKYHMSWAPAPHVVSLGAEKNFSRFMELVSREPRVLPDERFFKRLVAKAILFKECDRIVAQQDFGGYKANVVTYTVAWLSYLTEQRLDLEAIWQRQALSPSVLEALRGLSKVVWQHIDQPPPNARNRSEWAKREACWTALKSKSQPLGDLGADLLPEGSPGEASVVAPADLTAVSPEAEREIALVEAPDADWWFGLAHWAAQTDNLQGWQRKLAFSMGRLKARGQRPTTRQAHQAARIMGEAGAAGYRMPGDQAPLAEGEGAPPGTPSPVESDKADGGSRAASDPGGRT